MTPKKKKKRLPSPEEILSGRYKPKIEELFEWIHRINPTGAHVSKEAKEKAYALKADLQSYLIEHFGEYLQVFPMPGAGNEVVGLRHRTYYKNACHVPVARLSPAAREWVRLRLLEEGVSTAGGSPIPPELPPPKNSPEEEGGESPVQTLLAQGDAALEEYDYDLARKKYELALSHRETETNQDLELRAARSLLTLLVDHLVDDKAALALVETLNPRIQEDPDLRCLAGLSCARLGKVREALKWAGKTGADRAPEVFLECARVSLRAGELERCRDFLALVPAQGAYHSAREGLARSLREKYAEKARPLEVELSMAVEKGEENRSETLAREILALDPDNPLAHRTLREIRERREKDRALGILEEIEGCLNEGDPSRAELLLRDLREIKWARGNIPLEEWRERVQRAGEKERRDRLAARVRSLRSVLEFPLDGAMVETYWEAPEEVRKGLQESLARSKEASSLAAALSWLEDFGPPAGACKPAEAAKAANFLVRAGEAKLEAPDERIWEDLAPFRETLSRSTRGKRFLKASREAWKNGKIKNAEKILREAARLASRDFRRAWEVFSSLDRSVLTPDQNSRADRLEKDLERLGRVEEIRAALAETDPKVYPFKRISFLDELAPLLANEEAVEIEKERDATYRAVQETWMEAKGEGPSIALQTWGERKPSFKGLLSKGEKTWAFFVEQVGPRVFIRLFSPGFARSLGAAFKLPRPARILGASPEGPELLLATEEGILRVDPLGGFELKEFMFWRGSPDLRPFEEGFFLQGSRYLWVYVKGDSMRDGCVRILNVKKGEFSGKPMDFRILRRLGGNRPQIAALSQGNNLTFLDAAGRLFCKVPGSMVFLTAASHPKENKVVAILAEREGLPDRWAIPLNMVSITRDGKVETLAEVGNAPAREGDFPWVDAVTAMATSKENRATFFLLPPMDGECLLGGASLDSPGPDWSLHAPERSQFLEDPQEERVWLHWEGRDRAGLVPLGKEKPDLSFKRPKKEVFPDYLLGEKHSWEGESASKRGRFYVGALSLLDNEGIHRHIEEMVRRRPPLEDIQALAAIPLPARSREIVLRALAEDYPRESFSRVALAHRHIQRGDFSAALREITDSPLPGLDPETEQHRGHIRALALFGSGRWEEALSQAKKSLRVQGACGPMLQDLVRFIKTWEHPNGKLLKLGAPKSTRSFAGRLRAADSALEKKNWKKVLEYLEHPAIWTAPHPQALARLGKAYLSLDAEGRLGSDGKWRTRMILTEFLASRFSSKPPLPLGPGARSEEWMAAMESQALQWLGDKREDYTPTPGSEDKEPDPFFGRGNPVSVQKVPTSGPQRNRGRVLEDRHLKARLMSAVPLIQERIQGLRPVRNHVNRVGFLVVEEHEDFREFKAVAEHLLGFQDSKNEAVLPLTKEFALEYFSSYPGIYYDFIRFHQSAFFAKSSVFVLLHPEGAVFTTIPR